MRLSDDDRRVVLEIVHGGYEGTLEACRRSSAVRRLLEAYDALRIDAALKADEGAPRVRMCEACSVD